MEKDTEGPVRNGPFDDAMAVDTGIGIIHEAETMLLTNQTHPEIDAPPLPSPKLPPIAIINVTAQLQFNAKDSSHDGYDSEGELGPFYDAIMDEASDSEDDEELPTAAGVEPSSTIQLPTDVPPLPPPSLLTEVAIKSMNVAQLKDQLKKRELTVSGVRRGC